jgi:UDP-glucose 4-epimerase
VTLTWVVGAGGLLGSHVARSAARRGPVWTGPAVAWRAPPAADQLASAAQSFLRAADGGPWQVAWCAGAGVTSTEEQWFVAERRLFDSVLAALGPGGALFVASSAGGVYAGSAGPPFTEQHAVAPLSAYGRFKLSLEESATAWAGRTGNAVLVGRIANLYGPGQDLAKAQGLISQLCRAHLRGQPTSLFVPMDTLRDYLFAPDCGELVLDALERLRAEGGVHVKILASQRAVTVGAVVGELRRIFKAAPHIIYGSSPSSHLHARDLRLRSQVWTELDRRPVTPLPAGIKATVLSLNRSLLAGQL